MTPTLRFPIVGLLLWVLAVPQLAIAAAPLAVGSRCELMKPIKISVKAGGRGRKFRIARGTHLSIIEIDDDFVLVESEEHRGYVKVPPLTRKCAPIVEAQPVPAVVQPAEPAQPLQPMALVPADDGSGIGVEPLQFGGDAAGAVPDAPPDTHQCDYQSVEECGAQCDLGHAGSCYSAGEQRRFLMSKRPPEPADHRRVAALYTRACNRHHADGCLRLGEIYERGEGVQMDDRVVAALYEKACTLGAALGCTNVGYLYWSGEGVAVDQQKAAEMYSLGCDLGSAQGCTSLGSILQTGNGMPKDPAGAFALFRKACYSDPLLGAQGCANLGYCYEAGLGIAANRQRSIDVYRKACTGKAAYGCERLQALGEPLPTPPAPAPAAAAADTAVGTADATVSLAAQPTPAPAATPTPAPATQAAPASQPAPQPAPMPTP